MKIIDPHLHLFDLKQGDYHWLKEENPPFWPDKHLIKKSFKETDLTLKPIPELPPVIIQTFFINHHFVVIHSLKLNHTVIVSRLPFSSYYYFVSSAYYFVIMTAIKSVENLL